MAIGPMGKTDTLPAWNFTVVTAGTSTPQNLTGASFALSLIYINNTATPAKPGAGTFVIISAVNGQAQYQWSSSDLTLVGTYLLRVTITLAGGQLTASEETVTVF